MQKSGTEKWPLRTLLLLILLESGFFFFYGLSRHYNYLSSLNDLGCFDQAIWGVLNGAPFLNTILFGQPINWLGFHFHPVLLLFVPFYMIVPSVNWLILAQAAALPLTALPIYCLVKHRSESARLALLWSLVCLASPFLLSAASWDFHPASLAVPVIALAYLAVEKKQFPMLLACCVVILLCKEHFGLLVAGFGLLWLARHRRFSSALLLILLGVGHFLLVLQVVMPLFSPADRHLMMTPGFDHLARYSWLGTSVPDMAAALVNQPAEIFRAVVFDMQGWLYLCLLFVPFLGLPLVGLEFLLPGLADLAANLLSATPMPRSVFAYHSVPLVPVFVVAAFHGSRRLLYLLGLNRVFHPVLLVLVFSLILSWVFFPFFSLPGGFRMWEPKQVWQWQDETYAEVLELLPETSSLSVQANLGSHFSQRHKVYRFPLKTSEADAVVLRLESPTSWNRSEAKFQVGSLGHHLQMSPQDYLQSVEALLANPDYAIVLWQDPWLVFSKSEAVRPVADEVILQKIQILRKAWQ